MWARVRQHSKRITIRVLIYDAVLTEVARRGSSVVFIIFSAGRRKRGGVDLQYLRFFLLFKVIVSVLNCFSRCVCKSRIHETVFGSDNVNVIQIKINSNAFLSRLNI